MSEDDKWETACCVLILSMHDLRGWQTIKIPLRHNRESMQRIVWTTNDTHRATS